MCLWCRKIKDSLKKNNVRFKEVDMARDHKAARDMVRKFGQ